MSWHCSLKSEREYWEEDRDINIISLTSILFKSVWLSLRETDSKNISQLQSEHGVNKRLEAELFLRVISVQWTLIWLSYNGFSLTHLRMSNWNQHFCFWNWIVTENWHQFVKSRQWIMQTIWMEFNRITKHLNVPQAIKQDSKTIL